MVLRPYLGLAPGSNRIRGDVPMIPNEVVLESIEVPKDLAAVMQEIPRHFNETLTDWAIRCQVLRRYQPVEETNAEPTR